jgi:hypothetical protein
MTVDNIPRGEPPEIAARGVHKFVTEKINSQGESPCIRAVCSVVRPGGSRQVVRGKLALGSILSFQERVQKAEMDFLLEEL